MKRIISDCFKLGAERLYDNERILTVIKEYDEDFIDLDNGVTIQGMGDGRFYNADDDTDRYAAVFDWDDELDQGDLVGYVQL